MQDASDAELVARALMEDKQAFNLLIERYQGMALMLALRSVSAREIAYELVQESLLQAYLSLSRLRDGSRFKSWLYGIVLNLCRNWRRAQSSVPETWELAGNEWVSYEADPADLIEERELRQVLRDALEVLSPSNREAAILFYYEDQSIQAIARQLQVSPTAVRNRLLKGRAQLREHLQTIYPDMRVITTRSYRRLQMIPMTVANVTRHEKLLRTTVLLVDEPRQRGLLLWFVAERDFVAQLRMSVTTDAKSVMADADYPQLILGIVQALEGTLEVIEIDALEGDILYARVKVRGVDGRARSIKTRLGNALPLLAQARCPAEVAEVVLETQGLRLSDFGGTFEEQVEALARRGEQLFALGASQALSPVRTPRNMDFREGFRGWSFMGYPDKPKHYTYRIAEDITFQGKPSLEIVLEELEHTVEETYLQRFAILMHEGFVADNYRDQRLRMCAYARAAHVEQGVFSLHINGPAPTDAQERKTMYMAGNNEHPIEGTSDWSPYEIVIDVPEDAETIQCSFQIRGYGKVWLDGFRFEIVDRSVPLTGTRVVPPPRQPSNLKFERQFEGWLLVGSRPQDYEKHTEIDESGVRVAHLKNRVELARGNCELQQTINTYDCRGKTVRVTVQARCEELSEQASLYLAAGLANKARIERPLQDDKGWQSYEMSLFIPDEPGQLQFGLRLLGAGQVWLRDVSFAIV